MEKEPQILTNLVSVIIPTYKRSNRLPIAIKSVLNQTYPNIEIIVVDDNGPDEYSKATESKLKSYIENNQIKYIKHSKNKGGCIARNTGANNALGNLITFLDDDDFYEPNKIQEQVVFLHNNIQLDACMCAMFRIDENNNEIKSRENFPRGINLKEAILDGNLFTSMLLMKRDVFLTLEGFSEISRFQDKYFHYKFLENGYSIGILDKQLLTLVEHSDFRISLSASNKIINALNTLHGLEVRHKSIFLKKEWKYIMHRLHFNKAYTLQHGNLKQKINALINITKSFPFYTGDFNIVKLTVKTLLPNFLFKH